MLFRVLCNKGGGSLTKNTIVFLEKPSDRDVLADAIEAAYKDSPTNPSKYVRDDSGQVRTYIINPDALRIIMQTINISQCGASSVQLATNFLDRNHNKVRDLSGMNSCTTISAIGDMISLYPHLKK